VGLWDSCNSGLFCRACIIDLLGHASHLLDAEDLKSTMTCIPDASVWKALLCACRIHGDLVMGEYIANQVLEVDSSYVLLSNIYQMHLCGRRCVVLAEFMVLW
jgi:hypothetical protein